MSVYDLALEGGRMRAAVVVAILCLAVGGEALGALDWEQAADCVGRTCSLEGTVASQEDEGGVTRLYFDRERRDVSVLLVHSLFATWPDYTGRAIVATGKARRFRDQIELVVSRQRDIEIAGEPTPTAGRDALPEVEPESTPTAAPEETRPEPPVPGDGEVERLRQKVRQLEEKVRELEGGQ